MKKYTTNFTRGAYHQWTCSKAVMEFVSNWLDSDGERSHSFSDNTLTLINSNIKVSNKMLMMGLSDKRDDDTKRGMFGFGSVQAMVVLSDLGYNISVINCNVLWSPRFEMCENFQEEVMVIDETPYYDNTDFTVTITGLTEEDIEEIKARCLIFQDREVLHSTEYGDIICNEAGEGEVFCGDIYVCENKGFKQSYNFKPKVVPLNSERSAVDNWELKKLTALMISSVKDTNFVIQCIESGKLDTRLVNNYWGGNTSEEVNDSFAEEFIKENGACLVTSDYDEHLENERIGNKSVYIENESKCLSITNSSVYQEALEDTVLIEREDPNDIINEVIDLLFQEEIIPRDAVNEQHEGVGSDIKQLLYKLKGGIKWANNNTDLF